MLGQGWDLFPSGRETLRERVAWRALDICWSGDVVVAAVDFWQGVKRESRQEWEDSRGPCSRAQE